MIPLFSSVMRPQSMLPESSSMNKIFGSTELLRNSGDSDNVPGADNASVGKRSADISSVGRAAFLARVVS